jgi:hypothetical protein
MVFKHSAVFLKLETVITLNESLLSFLYSEIAWGIAEHPMSDTEVSNLIAGASQQGNTPSFDDGKNLAFSVWKEQKLTSAEIKCLSHRLQLKETNLPQIFQ